MINRRTLLIGTGIGLTAAAVTAGPIWDALTGHINDAKDRILTKDSFVPNSATTAAGTFDETADGQDAAHWAKGSVSIEESEGKRYIQLHADFNSGPLPDGHVYYSAATDINNESDFNSSVQIDVGSLLKGNGASFYEVPMNAEINSVTIWCKRFGEYIGSADVWP